MFVSFAAGLTGLAHVSQLSDEYLPTVTESGFTVGQVHNNPRSKCEKLNTC